MSEVTETVKIEYSLEELRCSLCKSYLSCAPIQLLPDGRNVCGRCHFGDGESPYRNVILESIISKTTFPCQFKKNGCKQYLPFGHAVEHEGKCKYSSVVCPFVSNGACAWEGSALQIADHFSECHSDSIVENAKFKLQIDQNAENLLMLAVDNIALLVRFMYHANGHSLHYNARYFTSDNVQNVTYKIKLANSEDLDYCAMLKGGNCLPYSSSIYDVQESQVLIIDNFLPILSNPKNIIVGMDFVITKSNNEDSQENLTVDYDLLQAARCKECRGYLIPPNFDCKKGVVCSNCYMKFDDSKPSTMSINERLARTNFPCLWRGCGFLLFDY